MTGSRRCSIGVVSLLALVSYPLTSLVAQSISLFPAPAVDSNPYGIVAGPDGNLWFTESGANNIGRISATGVITEFPIPTADSGPSAIAAGPDGNLWFTESGV